MLHSSSKILSCFLAKNGIGLQSPTPLGKTSGMAGLYYSGVYMCSKFARHAVVFAPDLASGDV
jgi:hypothetical protein